MNESIYEWKNNLEKDFELIFEPDGIQFTISPESKITIVAKGEEPGTLESEIDESCIIVYAWPSSIVKVFIDDILDYENNSPIPSLPAGMSTRDFVKLLFTSKK